MEKKISSPDLGSFERAFTSSTPSQESTDHSLANGVGAFFGSPTTSAKPIEEKAATGGFGDALDGFLDLPKKAEDNSEEHQKIDNILHSFDKDAEKVTQQ
jgi:hypothetical protein